MDKVSITISKKYQNKTIKEFLKDNNVGRGKVESIRVNKTSFINDQYKNIDTLLNENDVLSFAIDEKIDFVCDNNPLDVVYEDEHILIVNKPSNMIIHPDDKSKSGTLVNIVANYYKQNNINRNIRYIHRIDKETTGIVLFAKDFLSEAILLKDLQEDKINRLYLAIVEGKLSKSKGVIKAPIGKDRHINNKMCVSSNGKEAISEYKVIKSTDKFSLIEFKLLTGRTHQIRVHASYINHPLLGDVMYGGDLQYISRVALHSYKIELIHPISKKAINIECQLPNDIKKLI